MTFVDFYSQHYELFTTLIVIVAAALLTIIGSALAKLVKMKSIKTPWFEIASDSVEEPESDDMAKTRLLLNRQFEYMENCVKGWHPIILKLAKSIVEDAMKVSRRKKPNEGFLTAYINVLATEMSQVMTIYFSQLLINNHIGTDKTKIKKYCAGHVGQIIGMTKECFSRTYMGISGKVCMDTQKYWKEAGINDPEEWIKETLLEMFIGLSELRYSDFDDDSVKEELKKRKFGKKN